MGGRNPVPLNTRRARHEGRKGRSPYLHQPTVEHTTDPAVVSGFRDAIEFIDE
jgi:hypothetical protein